MLNVGDMNNTITGYYGKDIRGMNAPKRSEETKKTQKTNESAAKTGSAENGLSDKAKEFLKNLREANSDMDFYVGDKSDDLHSLMSGSKKDVSVAFTSDELEKMAEDEDYANEKMNSVSRALDMIDSIGEQYDFEGQGINARIGITFGDDGEVNIFAELEKMSDKQRERIEAQKEARTKEKDEAIEKLEEKRAEGRSRTPGRSAEVLGAYGRNEEGVKKITLNATSEDDLIEQLQKLDWSSIKAEPMQYSGVKFDSAI